MPVIDAKHSPLRMKSRSSPDAIYPRQSIRAFDYIPSRQPHDNCHETKPMRAIEFMPSRPADNKCHDSTDTYAAYL